MSSRRAQPAPTATTAAPALPADTRQRLLGAGLRLFAQQGYSKTSTRELADAASINVAAISYYFGDKAGLYQAVLSEPLGPIEDELARFNDPALSLEQALRGFFEGFLVPLRNGDGAQLCMKLHFREMLEPTGLGRQALLQGIRPLHEQLLRVLRRALGLGRSDADLQRLAVSVAGLGVYLHVGHDINETLAPGLMAGRGALDTWGARLAMYALAMVRAEAERRGITLQERTHA